MALAACGGGGGGTTGGGGASSSPSSVSSGGQGGGASSAVTTGAGGAGPTVSADAVKLCQLVNEYRVESGLPAVPLSAALMTVAAYHVADQIAEPQAYAGKCNLHSWSDASPLWKGCCFTPDFAEAQCMWAKPGEITAGWGAGKAYLASGYEDAAAGAQSPEQALMLWKGSPAHNDVILNKNDWAAKGPWPAMGCGMTTGKFAVLWFGDASDPQTYTP
jgi:hypothetical protein